MENHIKSLALPSWVQDSSAALNKEETKIEEHSKDKWADDYDLNQDQRLRPQEESKNALFIVDTNLHHHSKALTDSNLALDHLIS